MFFFLIHIFSDSSFRIYLIEDCSFFKKKNTYIAWTFFFMLGSSIIYT